MMKHVFVSVFLFFLFVSCDQALQQPVYQFSTNNPAETGSRFPNFYQDESGIIYMSWLASIEEEIYALRYSRYGENGWEYPETVMVETDFFVNWADFPSVVGKDGEAFAAHRLKKREGGPYSYDVEILFRNSETGRWDQAIVPHRDGTATEHGFVSLEPGKDGSLFAVWLDGRQTADRGDDEYDDISKAMTIRSAEITPDGEIIRQRVIDSAVCDCCQTDLTATDNGYLAVYRDRSEDEIRDIKIARYSDETGEWSEPTTVHEDGWQIQACPVNGPRIVSNGNNVAVAWYTEADGAAAIYLAKSDDSGETFQEPILIADESLNTVGRVDLLMTDDGRIFVSWLQADGGNGYVIITETEPDGTVGNMIHAGTTSSSRSSGFPRIVQHNESILVAWTQTEPFLRVRTAKVDFADFISEER
jgi:hypothetical protein